MIANQLPHSVCNNNDCDKPERQNRVPSISIDLKLCAAHCHLNSIVWCVAKKKFDCKRPRMSIVRGYQLTHATTSCQFQLFNCVAVIFRISTMPHNALHQYVVALIRRGVVLFSHMYSNRRHWLETVSAENVNWIINKHTTPNNESHMFLINVSYSLAIFRHFGLAFDLAKHYKCGI